MNRKNITGKLQVKALALAILGLVGFGTQAFAQDGDVKGQKKKWTILVFMNGNNNLDDFGYKDLNEMEAQGSNENVNIVVQWASEGSEETHRVFVKQDNDPNNVTSPKVETFPRVDMGDYKELTKFLEWAIERYPAEHYFVDVWNHGNGWVKGGSRSGGMNINNISYDDFSGNSISIPELASSLKAASAKAGKKIDIYGSDACLMAMAEVAAEIAPYANVMVGSEEVEPLDGWPYDLFLEQLNSNINATPQRVGEMLTDTYFKYYEYETRGLTFSVMDLNQMAAFSKEFRVFSNAIRGKLGTEAKQVLQAAKLSESYESHDDYIDLMGFIKNLEDSTASIAQDQSLGKLKKAFESVVVYNKNFRMEGLGMAVWIPVNTYTLNENVATYRKLKFHQDTDWGATLETLLEKAGSPDDGHVPNNIE